MKKVLYFLPLLLLSCANKHEVDLSNIDISYNIIRYDSLLFGAEINKYPVYFDKVYKDHPEFTKIYCENIYKLGVLEADQFNLSKELKYLITNPDIQNIYKESQSIQTELTDGLEELDLALKYFNYHFPKINTPDIYIYNGKFEYASIIGQNFIGIAKEMCLGKDHPYLKNSGMPQYLARKLNVEHMPVHALQNLLITNFPQQSADHLLDFMIYNGKILYCMDAILPFKADSIKIGYGDGKIEWCRQNENEIWSWLMKHDLLYNAQQTEFLKLTMDGPNTAGMPAAAPGNIASYMGWNIVRQYMEKYPETTLVELMTSPGLFKGENILNRSGYKPR